MDELEPRDVAGIEPALRAVGYELRPSKMRPSVWEFSAGESNERHRQREQEELRPSMEVDAETFAVTTGDCIVVPAESLRQLTAGEPSRMLVVGFPNVADDAVDAE